VASRYSAEVDGPRPADGKVLVTSLRRNHERLVGRSTESWRCCEATDGAPPRLGAVGIDNGVDDRLGRDASSGTTPLV
jgi:hypothetical protein